MSRKISRKHLNEKGIEKQKIQYYVYMTRYYIHEKMILDIAKAQQVIFDTINGADAAQGLDPTGNLKQVAF